jgi:hypothetical protein
MPERQSWRRARPRSVARCDWRPGRSPAAIIVVEAMKMEKTAIRSRRVIAVAPRTQSAAMLVLVE